MTAIPAGDHEEDLLSRRESIARPVLLSRLYLPMNESQREGRAQRSIGKKRPRGRIA